MKIPWAKWVPSRGVDGGSRETQYKALILHTAVSTADDLGFPDPARPGIGIHLYLLKDGSLHQYLDTDRRTGHAWDANDWAIGMESQDTGSSPNPGPWTPNQLDTIDRLCRTLGIPAQWLAEGPSSGLSYHRRFDSWNQSHHSCPGDLKVAQMAGIIDRLKGDDDLTPEEHGWLSNLNAYREQKMKRHGIDPKVDGANDKLAKIEAQAERAALGLDPTDGTVKTPVPATMPTP